MTLTQIRERLVDEGYRSTKARDAVIAALLAYPGHMTADDLYNAMRREGQQVGRMTIFRTLDILAEIGVIRPIYQGSGAAHFVLFDDGHHHHLVCTQCATTIEFEDCGMAQDLTQALSKRFKFSISAHLLEVYGLCANCQPD